MLQVIELSGELVVSILTDGHWHPEVKIEGGLQPGNKLKSAHVVDGVLSLYFDTTNIPTDKVAAKRLVPKLHIRPRK